MSLKPLSSVLAQPIGEVLEGPSVCVEAVRHHGKIESKP